VVDDRTARLCRHGVRLMDFNGIYMGFTGTWDVYGIFNGTMMGIQWDYGGISMGLWWELSRKHVRLKCFLWNVNDFLMVYKLYKWYIGEYPLAI